MKFVTTLSVVAVLGAIGLLGWGAYTYYLGTRSVPPVEVESPERDLGEYPVGTNQVVFRITNPSDHPAEYLSIAGCCGRNCCLEPLTQRQTIPPGGSLDVVCELLVSNPRQFEVGTELFLNDNGLRAVKLSVRGVGVAPAGKTNEPLKP